MVAARVRVRPGGVGTCECFVDLPHFLPRSLVGDKFWQTREPTGGAVGSMSSSKFTTLMIQFVPASFVVGAGMELFMLNTVSGQTRAPSSVPGPVAEDQSRGISRSRLPTCPTPPACATSTQQANNRRPSSLPGLGLGSKLGGIRHTRCSSDATQVRPDHAVVVPACCNQRCNAVRRRACGCAATRRRSVEEFFFLALDVVLFL